MNSEKVITNYQIEEQAILHLKHYHEKTNFKNILQYLTDNNMYTEFPSFLYSDIQWNELSDDEFYQVISQLPVTLNAIRFSSQDVSYKGVVPADPFIIADSIIPERLEVYAIKYIRDIIEKMHTHNYFEINYVMRGACKMIFENESRILSEGELCIIAPNSRHDVTLSDDSIVVCIMLRKKAFETTFFQLLAQEDLLASFLKNILYSKKETANYMIFSTDNDSAIKNAIKGIFMECYVFDHYSSACVISRVHLLFSLLLRRYSDTISFYSNQGTENEHVNFTQILQYIEKNYRNVSLNSLAREFHYNTAYLSRMFKKNTGRTLVDILTEIKMSKASNLLLNTNYKIEEIATLIGYDSPDHFSRVFKKYYQTSPKQYSKLHNQI